MKAAGISQLDRALLDRSIVLFGLMGAGKTSVGRRLAAELALPFVDADEEIEAAAGCSIADFFQLHGEAEFRAGERRVIKRLLAGPVCVLATGGGAFMDAATRAAIRKRGISLWLRADLDVLVKRVRRRNNRPLLQGGDQRQILQDLMATRYPIYEQADIIVDRPGRSGPAQLRYPGRGRRARRGGRVHGAAAAASARRRGDR